MSLFFKCSIFFTNTYVSLDKIEPLTSGSAFVNDSYEKMRAASSAQSLGPPSLSSLLDKTVEDTSRVRKENKYLVDR